MNSTFFLTNIRAHKDRLLIKKGQRDQIKHHIKTLTDELTLHQIVVSDNDKLQILLRRVSEYAKSQVKEHIEKVVSNALNVVYGGNHKFIVEINERRNQHEVDYFIDDGFTIVKIEKPFVGKGGGKVSIVSLALRLAVAELMNIQGPVCLDEVSKMLDTEARLNLAYFLKEYSEKFGRQIIMVTHHKELSEAADKHIHISKDSNGLAQVDIKRG